MEKGPIELQGKKYPAKEHARRVAAHFQKRKTSPGTDGFFISGEDYHPIRYGDQAYPFKQNKYFYYLTGCNVPQSHVLYDLKSDKLTLFLPEIDYEAAMWSGMPLSIEESYKIYDADEIVYASEIEAKLLAIKGTIYTTDVDQYNEKFSKYLKPQDKDFFWSLDESRLIKDSFEIALMRHAAKITDNSHLAVMSLLPIETNEGHIHAEFMYHSIRQGAKELSYDPICCSGPNCSVLHYIKNDELFGKRNSILLDAGAEWSNYTSDVTRCFPIDGKWSKEHLEIYTIVLDMQKQTMDLIKPGVQWDDLHFLLHKILIKHFIELGIFKSGFSEEEIFESRVSTIFFPHGLGHLLGMETHDVGGQPNYEDPDEMLKYLRIRRPLLAGMVVTDEPGCYFQPLLIEAGLKDPKKAKFLDVTVIEKYYDVGGVRIEDDILVTETGYENLTGITSDPHEILKIVTEGIAKGRDHFHVIV